MKKPLGYRKIDTRLQMCCSIELFYDALKSGMCYDKEIEGGRAAVCKAIERYGEQQKLEKAKETAMNLHNMGMDNQFIAKAVNVSIDLVKQWLTPASA